MRFETSIQNIVRMTYNVKSFRFPRPPLLEYKPGQFMFITIKKEGKGMRKHFTISSSPTETEYLEFTKRLTGSDFSNTLDAMKAGDWIGVDAAYGDFTFTGEYNKTAMISGGIGITPLRSMCRYCTDNNLTCNIVLLYSNRTQRDIAFRSELEEMQKQNNNLKVLLTLTEPDQDWHGLTGRIDSQMIRTQIPDYRDRIIYTCGPSTMVEAMVSATKELGILEDRIKKENFPGY